MQKVQGLLLRMKGRVHVILSPEVIKINNEKKKKEKQKEFTLNREKKCSGYACLVTKDLLPYQCCYDAVFSGTFNQ